jgi:hypothetical protein
MYEDQFQYASNAPGNHFLDFVEYTWYRGKFIPGSEAKALMNGKKS